MTKPGPNSTAGTEHFPLETPTLIPELKGRRLESDS
jgi:hypothetical protein